MTDNLTTRLLDAVNGEHDMTAHGADILEAVNRIEELEAELAKAVEALDDLLEAITAEDRFRDRSLTITGSTANLKWLLDAENNARTTIAALKGQDDE